MSPAVFTPKGRVCASGLKALLSPSPAHPAWHSRPTGRTAYTHTSVPPGLTEPMPPGALPEHVFILLCSTSCPVLFLELFSHTLDPLVWYGAGKGPGAVLLRPDGLSRCPSVSRRGCLGFPTAGPGFSLLRSAPFQLVPLLSAPRFCAFLSSPGLSSGLHLYLAMLKRPHPSGAGLGREKCCKYSLLPRTPFFLFL